MAADERIDWQLLTSHTGHASHTGHSSHSHSLLSPKQRSKTNQDEIIFFGSRLIQTSKWVTYLRPKHWYQILLLLRPHQHNDPNRLSLDFFPRSCHWASVAKIRPLPRFLYPFSSLCAFGCFWGEHCILNLPNQPLWKIQYWLRSPCLGISLWSAILYLRGRWSGPWRL